MSSINRIIFVGQSGNCREVMAAEILKTKPLWHQAEILARGLIVLFPEPLNQKAEAVMAGNGFQLGKYLSAPLVPEDISDETLVLTFEQGMKKKIRSKFPQIRYLYVLTEVSGDELEILDPMGQDLITYGICYETLEKSITKLAAVLNDGFPETEEEQAGEPEQDLQTGSEMEE